MSKTNVSRGRPQRVSEGANVTLRIDGAKLALADEIAADLEAMMPGLKHSRGDVLRAAIARGLDAMRADVSARKVGKR